MTEPRSREHWHVATGLAGYGPDAADSDGFAYATTTDGLASLIQQECNSVAEQLYETAQTYGTAEQYEDAWKTLKRSEEFGIMALNFDPARARAPLYVHDPQAWTETVMRLIDEHFPADFEHSRLYVWKCQHPDDCDSYEDDPTDDETGS
jgi:hypothetical protein